MSKIKIICHMMSSLDGRIISANWGEYRFRFSTLYEQGHESFESQGWMCGRITMEKDFSKGTLPELLPVTSAVNRDLFIGNAAADSFAIAIDANGKLGWNENHIGGDHLIVVLSQKASDEYLFYLQRKGISYVVAGEDEVDFEAALDCLGGCFPIRTLMLEGGGHLNGSLLYEGLIDELSLLILPLVDGSAGAASSFEIGDRYIDRVAVKLGLSDVKQLDGGVVWLRYQVQHQSV